MYTYPLCIHFVTTPTSMSVYSKQFCYSFSGRMHVWMFSLHVNDKYTFLVFCKFCLTNIFLSIYYYLVIRYDYIFTNINYYFLGVLHITDTWYMLQHITFGYKHILNWLFAGVLCVSRCFLEGLLRTKDSKSNYFNYYLINFRYDSFLNLFFSCHY